MQATTGTKTAVWLSLAAALATAFTGWFKPEMITSLLPTNLSWLALPVTLLIQALLHGYTGNTPPGPLPGLVAAPDAAKGNLG